MQIAAGAGRQQPRGCSTFNDIDNIFHYSQDWLLSTVDPAGLKGTIHQALVNGSVANITFSGLSNMLL